MPTFVLLPWLLGTAFALQPPGTFHAGEAVARDGEPWLALRVEGNTAALVATRIDSRPVEDVVVDAPGERTGVEVGSIDGDGVLVFLRGGGLRAGAVDRARVAAGDGTSPPALPIDIAFAGTRYRIENHCDPEPARHVDGQAQFACSVLLRMGQTRQVLSRRLGYFEQGSDVMSFGDDGVQQLLFAGDLDRDGRLDLIFDTSDHYNKSRPTLFLSGQAANGEPLREVAHHESVGC